MYVILYVCMYMYVCYTVCMVCMYCTSCTHIALPVVIPLATIILSNSQYNTLLYWTEDT